MAIEKTVGLGGYFAPNAVTVSVCVLYADSGGAGVIGFVWVWFYNGFFEFVDVFDIFYQNFRCKKPVMYALFEIMDEINFIFRGMNFVPPLLFPTFVEKSKLTGWVGGWRCKINSIRVNSNFSSPH